MTASDVTSVVPCSVIGGTLRVPGDKSISHRLAMLAALADGECTIENFLCSEDCLNTLAAVESLGATVARDGSTVRIKGTAGRFRPPEAPIDLGNSGTGMRLLAGLLAGHDFLTELTGDESLCSRPMGRIREPLEMMGAEVVLSGDRGCAPLRIRGGNLRGITYPLPVASAQVKSCALLAGLFAGGETKVIEPKPTRDHTERLLTAMGVPVRVDGAEVSLTGCGDRPTLHSGRWRVPGDFSSSAFWMTAAACLPGAELRMEGVGLNPRRAAFLDVLRRMGANIECEIYEDRVQGSEWEPAGDLTVRGGTLEGTVVEGDEIPNLIDELPLVAVAGALAGGETVIRDAAELRVKESDRIRTTADALRAFGMAVEEYPDGLRIAGGRTVRGGGQVDSGGDHRIAMAAAVLGLFADAPVGIRGTACISTSYPGFWGDMESLRDRKN